MTGPRRRLAAGLLAVGLGLLGAAACIDTARISRVAADIARDQGYIDDDEAESLHRVIDATERSFEEITPEQEHYLGRAVAATLLRTYTPLDDEAANGYLNRVGQTLALASDRPETFGGYHFLLLDSDEINAFAAPGGFILVTRGMVDLCRDEDDLAAVLAHEIGHVVDKHGLQAIEKDRLTRALTVLTAEGARTFGSDQLRELVEDYEGSIRDITSTLVSRGYAREQESAADAEAVRILRRVGYDPGALIRLLETMRASWRKDGPGFLSTHPHPDDRIRELEPMMGPSPGPAPVARQERFAEALGAR